MTSFDGGPVAGTVTSPVAVRRLRVMRSYTAGQERAEQNDRGQIAIGNEVCERPGLDGNQERVLELRLDLARHIACDQEDEGWQHEHDRDPSRPGRRRPKLDERSLREAVDQENEACDGEEREQAFVWPLAQSRDEPLAQVRERRHHMQTEKRGNADNEECHGCPAWMRSSFFAGKQILQAPRRQRRCVRVEALRTAAEDSMRRQR